MRVCTSMLGNGFKRKLFLITERACMGDAIIIEIGIKSYRQLKHTSTKLISYYLLK